MEGVGVLRVLLELVVIVGGILEGDASGVDGRGVCSGVEVRGEVREGSEEATLGVLWWLVDIVGEGLESGGCGVCCLGSVVVDDSEGVGSGLAPPTVNVVANVDSSLRNSTNTEIALRIFQ